MTLLDFESDKQASDVCGDWFCVQTILRASWKDMFWFAFTLQISASCLYRGHLLSFAWWGPLQLAHFSVFEVHDATE